MMSLRRPSAANRIIFARMTSRYGDVYRAARCSRAARSSRVSVMANGLCLGTGAVRCGRERTIRGRPMYKLKYVIVIVEQSTKRYTDSFARWL